MRGAPGGPGVGMEQTYDRYVATAGMQEAGRKNSARTQPLYGTAWAPANVHRQVTAQVEESRVLCAKHGEQGTLCQAWRAGDSVPSMACACDAMPKHAMLQRAQHRVGVWQGPWGGRVGVWSQSGPTCRS